MRKLFAVVWLLIPVGLLAYHYGPGQTGLSRDKVAKLVTQAKQQEAKENWKAAMQAFAISMPTSRAPRAITLASLCSRASIADSGSDTSAQRQAGLRFIAIEMPTPDPQSAMPWSASPLAIAFASL